MAQNENDTLKTLKALLTDKAHIDHAKTRLRCSVENGTVTIEGTVDDISQKKRALFHAMRLPGIEGVVDRLKVRPSKSMSDAQIKEHITDALCEEQTLSPLDIGVEVRDGAVDLEGTVGSLTHKRLAGVLAWWVPGVCDVINSLEVSPPEEDADHEVDDAIRVVFEVDRLVNEGSISSKTRDWVVTLSGAAGSEAEKGAAEKDAWFVWGVNEVVNNVVVMTGRRPRP